MPFTDEQIAAFPVWLQKLVKMTPQAREAAGYSDEDLESAAKAHHLDKDYTVKSQRAAELEQIRSQYPDLSLKEAAELHKWWQSNGATVTDLWNRRDRLVERQPEPAKPTTAAEKRKWRDSEAAALYDTASMRDVFEDLHKDAVEQGAESGYQRWSKFYEETEKPRLDQVAGGYFETMLGLVDFAAEDAVLASRDPKHQRADLNEIIKQAALRTPPGQRADFRKVAAAWRDERLAAVKPIEEDAFKRGVEEGRKVAEGPSGPLGGARPGWRPEPNEPAPKTRDALFAKVVSAVEQKSGRPVPL